MDRWVAGPSPRLPGGQAPPRAAAPAHAQPPPQAASLSQGSRKPLPCSLVLPLWPRIPAVQPWCSRSDPSFLKRGQPGHSFLLPRSSSWPTLSTRKPRVPGLVLQGFHEPPILCLLPHTPRPPTDVLPPPSCAAPSARQACFRPATGRLSTRPLLTLCTEHTFGIDFSLDCAPYCVASGKALSLSEQHNQYRKLLSLVAASLEVQHPSGHGRRLVDDTTSALQIRTGESGRSDHPTSSLSRYGLHLASECFLESQLTDL